MHVLLSDRQSTTKQDLLAAADYGAVNKNHLLLSPETDKNLVLLPVADEAQFVRVLSAAIEECERGKASACLARLIEESEQALSTLSGKISCCSLVCSADTLKTECSFALKGVVECLRGKSDQWATPAGSFFTTRPLGGDSPISFMYGDFVAPYPGVTRDWCKIFPEMHDFIEERLPEDFWQITDEAWNFRLTSKFEEKNAEKALNYAVTK